VEIEHLKLLIAKLRRQQFGARRRNGNTRSSNWNCGWKNWKQGKPEKQQW